ncbi:ribosomal N-acetyltransferase YdaF [Clostridium aceticum]|uniref:Ribosomal N-acetyltransferase YdaF n=1 Tax=Clostridium aceticum TaxID=84022 RepID=A0A0D8I9J3_9CLOT|nr:GNAT family protein [Clostridium aceticum]AKL95739.1 ribosomal N-acetyltransferase YdaF [Clostridium aceticum]KJF26712.1 alanine acetyltransferase [Clostridium aceticum]
MFKYVVENDIELRLLQNGDAEELYKLIDCNRAYLRKWLPWVDSSKTCEDTKSFIESTMNQFASNNGFQAGIWYKGEITGIIGYHNIDWMNKYTSIGYWLSEKHVGKGIMTKACKAIIDYAFININLNRVEIRCAEYNHKSRAIPERLGFTKEGMIKEAEWLYDHYVNHIVYGILAKEWEQSSNV